MSKDKMPLPPMSSDNEAERFVSEADLSEYDLSGFKPLSSYDFAKKKDARSATRAAPIPADAAAST